MGGVQSGTHSLGDALWIQERQRQKCQRDSSRCESNGHGSHLYQHQQQQQQQHQQQQQTSTQERRKLLKRTRSLAVISEDESRAVNNDRDNSVQLHSPFDRATLQHRRPQLIPRAKLIDRHSLKDRLSKSQQHLSDSYERFSEPSVRPSQSRSVCGLYSLPPPLDSLPEPLPYTRPRSTWRPLDNPGRLNILEWPDSPIRYSSVQDLNSVSGLVDVIEDNFWPAEENRSVDCIYTQVKRKRKEHRSLDSILFEDDSDELEYFDILNLLPLSNVRLEIDEPKSKNSGVILERSGKISSNQVSKSHPTVLSVLSKKSSSDSKKYSTYKGRVSITEIEEFVPPKIDIDDKEGKIREDSDVFETIVKECATERSIITSFNEIARDKLQNESTPNNYDINVSEALKPTVQSYYSKAKETFLDKAKRWSNEGNKTTSSHLEGHKSANETFQIKEEIKRNEAAITTEAEEMSRRPQILTVIDNDITKPKHLTKSVTLDVIFADNDTACEENLQANNNVANYRALKVLSKPDIINDHVEKIKLMTNNSDVDAQSERLSVENARNFFEKKSADKDLSASNCTDGVIDKSIFGKSCSNVVKDSLGLEGTSESSDLGLGSEVGSDVRRLSVDECTNTMNGKIRNNKGSAECVRRAVDLNDKNQNNCTNLTRSRSCIDSIECQEFDEPEFDHVRYKIVKSNVFNKNVINSSKNDVAYDGLIKYLREYSFQDILMDNNVVIIEPVRAEVERKSSFNETKTKTFSSSKSSQNSTRRANNAESNKCDKDSDGGVKNHFIKSPRQSSLRKHFFYQPIRVNRELNDDELPDPDTVRNVRKMFEETMKKKLKIGGQQRTRGLNTTKSMSMKDLRMIDDRSYETGSEKAAGSSRSRFSSRAKDLRKMFENMDKSSPSALMNESKDGTDNIRNESKTRSIVQSFESRSGHTSPSNSNSSKTKASKYHQRNQLHNWDAGSVSSGVSSDYPDTDVGSALPCTSSEDEELYCQDDDGVDERYEGHYVSQDVLKKIREHGTSVTYYGGKVVNIYNGPLICPMVCKKTKVLQQSIDYVKFRLVKSNSCDSRLELTGRVENNRNKYELNVNRDKSIDLRQFTIDEAPSIEITTIEKKDTDEINDKAKAKDAKREPPVVIGLEPKKEENKTFKADFQLGKIDDSVATNRFASSALTRWQINENTWKRNTDFGKMEFEEYEVLEDSLNGTNA
ncbi:PREDICTED: uncharacterized protein LOC105364185 [Ceratosolen solmsi marchali]|uniref:Uncharacterized protein LOC105364185 n=1 Tax=Ceratosolen solmsi marchali TaxID=326594 RepID=A0AAJ6YLP6_9HYME|nr:PREDICTED: uncharacterized protein LOC105364185 [Ceratosolen solmsi marchali]